jgi:hypothetical protein
MSAWYFWLTPLAVLPVLMLLRFIGCTSFGASDDVSYEEKPPVGTPPPAMVPDYPTTISGEKDTSGNPVLVSYWRLQEPGTTAIPGTAKDEKGLNNGTYKVVTIAKIAADHSPATAQPTGKLTLGQPGMLGFEPADTSMEVQGGFVEVAPSLTLNTAQFTVEALLFPMWDETPPNQGLYYCVMESSGPIGTKKQGFGIYGGPQDASHLTTAYRWQVWLGNATKFQQVLPTSTPARAPALIEFNKTNYLAVTFDGTTLRIYSFFSGKSMDDVLALQETVPGYSPNAGLGVPLFIGMGLDLFSPFPTALKNRYPFNGRMQEVAVYRTALGTDRIASHIMAAFKDL